LFDQVHAATSSKSWEYTAIFGAEKAHAKLFAEEVENEYAILGAHPRGNPSTCVNVSTSTKKNV